MHLRLVDVLGNLEPRACVFVHIERGPLRLMALGGLRARAPEALEAPTRQDVLRQVEHLRHALGVDTLEEHARRGAFAVRHHHRVDGEGRDARDVHGVPADFRHHRPERMRRGDARVLDAHPLHVLHDVAVLVEIDRVLEHEHVRVHPEDLFAELLLKAARHAHHDGQRRDAEHHPKRGECRADGHRGALLRAEVPEGRARAGIPCVGGTITRKRAPNGGRAIMGPPLSLMTDERPPKTRLPAIDESTQPPPAAKPVSVPRKDD